MKKWIIAIACLIGYSLCLGALDGQPEIIVIDKKIFYKINSFEDLSWYMNQLNNQSDMLNALLESDIDIEKGAGTFKAGGKLSGVFDGQGHTIYNYQSSNLTSSSFFGELSGVVKNLNMENINQKAFRFGGIVGINKGEIENCHVQGVIEGGGYNDILGGIASENRGTIKNSSANIKIKAVSYGSNVGGIAGINYQTKIQNCFAIVDLDGGSHSARVGGIAGTNYGTIEMCHTEGIVKSSSHSTKIGGIVGINSGYLYDDYSSVDLYMDSWGNSAGGITARNTHDKSIQNTVPGVIKNCYTNTTYPGGYGIVDTNATSIQNSYFDSSIVVVKNWVSYKPAVHLDLDSESTYATLTADEMQTDLFAWILNTQNGMAKNSGRWSRYGGYPIFADSTHLSIQKIVFVGDDFVSEQFTSYTGEVSVPDSVDVPEGESFLGWFTKDGNRVTPVSHLSEGDTVYAKYGEESDVKWLVCFYNTDRLMTRLGCDSVRTGETPVYKGDAPTRENSIAFSYTFKEWILPEEPIFMDRMVYARYDSTVNVYTVRLCNSPDTTACDEQKVNAYDSVHVIYGQSDSLYVTSGIWYDKNDLQVRIPSSRYIQIISDTSLYQEFSLREASSSSKEAKSSSSSAEDNVSSSSSEDGSKDFVLLEGPKLEMTVNAFSRSIRILAASVGSTYVILDMQGRVLQKDYVKSANFDVAVSRAGSYLVRIGGVTKRVIVK